MKSAKEAADAPGPVRCGYMVRPTARFSPVIDISHAGIGGGARCLDAESLQRAPKSPPDASWTDPFSRVPSVDPATRRSPSHRTVGSKATRSGGPFRLRASRFIGKRDPKAARPAKPFHPKASRPVDLSVNRHPDPLGRPPEGGDPSNRSTERLPGPPTFPSPRFPVRWARARRLPTRRTFPPEGILAGQTLPPEGFRIPWSPIRRPNSTTPWLNKIRRATIKNFTPGVFSCG